MKAVLWALVAAYAGGEITLREFQEWLIPPTWNIDRFPSPVVEMIRAMQLSLAEFDSGDISEEDLKNDLMMITMPTPVVVESAISQAVRRAPSKTSSPQTHVRVVEAVS